VSAANTMTATAMLLATPALCGRGD
jgi:hypothetical protein